MRFPPIASISMDIRENSESPVSLKVEIFERFHEKWCGQAGSSEGFAPPQLKALLSLKFAGSRHRMSGPVL
ncbi:MAG TPA: hypothetical protein DD706_09265 [Nitrospiraceae bacterium]|nr:hypothetical protein [Nitrospiraceae bacterium]